MQLGFNTVDVAIFSPIVDKFVKSAVAGLTQTTLRRRELLNGKTVVRKVKLKVKNFLLSLAKAHNGIRLPKKRRV